MRYYRCKCGHRECHSTMGVADCEGCEQCGTTLAEAPNDHETPAPHDWKEEWTIDKETGVCGKIRMCQKCYKREVLPAPAD